VVEDLTLSKAIDFAVETEKLGHHLYSRLARRFEGDEELHALFSTLAEDEKHHAEQFAQLRDVVAAQGDDLSFEQKQYLRAVSLSDIFSGEAGLGKKPDEIKDRNDALQRAYNLEKTTLLYYQAMKEVLDHEIVDEMIAEEKKHLTRVMKYMVTDAEFRGLGDTF